MPTKLRGDVQMSIQCLPPATVTTWEGWSKIAISLNVFSRVACEIFDFKTLAKRILCFVCLFVFLGL